MMCTRLSGLTNRCVVQLGTSIGLAVTSTIANAVSEKYSRHHPDLASSDPLVLMAGFRAGGWVCVGVLVISMIIGLFGMHGIGIVGQQSGEASIEKQREGDVELASHTTTVRIPSAGPSTLTVNTAVADSDPHIKKYAV